MEEANYSIGEPVAVPRVCRSFLTEEISASTWDVPG